MPTVNPSPSQLELAGQLTEISGLTMINLLRFRSTADYSENLALDPGEDVSGRRAYELYMDAALPIAAEYNGRSIVRGVALPLLVGPEKEHWDEAYLMRWPADNAFVRFIGDDRYQAVVGHRTAAVRDSRLIPVLDGLA